MWRSHLANQRALLLLLVLALNSCSDSEGPSPGTFQAQLTGARVASLSGSANAQRSFIQEFPDLQFFSRILSTSQGGSIVLESAEGSFGTLTIEKSQPGRTAGTFIFRGTMLVDAESVGILEVAGSFSADVF